MSDLRKHLRIISPELAYAADDLWRRSKPIHERQNRPGSLTQNGHTHIKAVEEGIWRLLSSTTRQGKADSLDKFDHPFPLFILSAAACCHDFDKAMETTGFDHGEGSADFIQKNQLALGLSRQQRQAIQSAIRIHDFKSDEFQKELEKLNTEEAGPDGEYNLQLVAVLLKASDILHCDSSRILGIPITDPATLEEVERVKYLSRNAVKGWNLNGTKIEIQIMAEDAEEFGALRESFDYMIRDEWSSVSDVLMHKQFPYDLTMPNLPPLPDDKESVTSPTVITMDSLIRPDPLTNQLKFKKSIESLQPPFDSENISGEKMSPLFFDKTTPFVDREFQNCSFQTLLHQLKTDYDVIILSGSQQMGKSWLVKRLIDAVKQDDPGTHFCYVRVSPKEIVDVVQDVTKYLNTIKDKGLTQAEYSKYPEYVIYALWWHKILWSISIIPDEYVSEKKYSLYKFNAFQLLKDIVKEKNNKKDKSVFWIGSKLVEDALSEADIHAANILVFLECDNIHKIENAYSLPKEIIKTKETFFNPHYS